MVFVHIIRIDLFFGFEMPDQNPVNQTHSNDSRNRQGQDHIFFFCKKVSDQKTKNQTQQSPRFYSNANYIVLFEIFIHFYYHILIQLEI